MQIIWRNLCVEFALLQCSDVIYSTVCPMKFQIQIYVRMQCNHIRAFNSTTYNPRTEQANHMYYIHNLAFNSTSNGITKIFYSADKM
jgi:hypothetical protein